MAMEVVNGYVCRNCTDVEYAKKGVDPAHPKDGPQGAYAVDKAGKSDKAEASGKPDSAKGDHGPAVTFGGGLTAPDAASQPAAYAPGANLSLKV
jgi:hypothetical protein